MAATAVTVTNIDHKTPLTKPAAVACDAVNGNRAANGGTLVLELTSSAGGTVMIAFPDKVDGQSVSPLTYTLTGAQTIVVGGWPVSIYGPEVVFTASASTITYIAYQV